MKRNFSSALLCIFIFASNAINGDASNKCDFSTRHGLALAVGGPALVGPAYRKFFENGLGFQTSFLVYPTSSNVDMIFSAHLFYTLNDTPELMRVYTLLGTAAIWQEFQYLILMPGAGLGIEFFLNRNLSLALDLALAPIINVTHAQHVLGFFPLPFLGLVLTYYI